MHVTLRTQAIFFADVDTPLHAREANLEDNEENVLSLCFVIVYELENLIK